MKTMDESRWDLYSAGAGNARKNVPTSFGILLTLIFSLAVSSAEDIVQRAAPEGGKWTGSGSDLQNMIHQINDQMENYRLQQGWQALNGSELEQARAYAFQKWAEQHHGDFGIGSKLNDIKNMELPSNLGGPVDIDWLATMGNRGALAKGPIGALTYMAGKEAWFALRAERPDRSSFASTYPDSNWRAVSAADLLLSGKASAEEVFLPGQATQVVQEKLWQHQFQRSVNDSIPFMSSTEKRPQADPGGVKMDMQVGMNSFERSDRTLDGYLCVSLKALATAAAAQRQAGRLSEVIAWVGGMTWVDGIACNDNDLVLIGRVLANRPGIHLDDVALLLRGAEGPAPYCSLDPKPENVLRLNQMLLGLRSQHVISGIDVLTSEVRKTIGDQQVVLGNLPPSRAAEILVSADYDCKKLSQGLLSAPDLTSMLDRYITAARTALAQHRSIARRSGMSRVWFCMGDHQPVFGTNAAGIVWLDECKVVVRTERQVATKSGRLSDANGGPDEEAEAFTTNFSEEMTAISNDYVSIAALENLFRLQAVFRAAVFLHEFERADLGYFRDTYPLQLASPLPASLPGLANGKLVTIPNSGGGGGMAILMPVVCGGVDLDVQVTPRKCTPANTAQSLLGAKALSSRPDAKTVFWGIHS